MYIELWSTREVWEAREVKVKYIRHWYSAFILKLKALYNTLWGTLPDCLFRPKLHPRRSIEAQPRATLASRVLSNRLKCIHNSIYVQLNVSMKQFFCYICFSVAVIFLEWKLPENARVSDCFVDFVINWFSVGLTNVTKNWHRQWCLPLKVATGQSVVFLVLAECLSAKIFSSSCSKFGKQACCASFSLRLLLTWLLAGRSKAKEKFGWSSIYCYHFSKL